MKPFLIFGLMIQLSAAQAMADSFTVIREGREYLCSTTGNGPRPPSGPGGGAADCSNKAYNGPFSRSESLELCSGAYDEGPADCGIKAYAGPFSRSEAMELCKRTGTIAHAECAIKAYAGPYSRSEAIALCKSQPNLMLRSLELLESSPEIQSKVQKMKSTLAIQ